MDNREIKLTDFISVAVKRLWILVLAAIIGAGAALYYSKAMIIPKYQVHTSFLVDTGILTNEEEEIETYQPQIERYVPQKPQRQAQKTSYSAPQTNSRDKYTSTMDQNLRRKIRIECAKRGILFKTFVEEACREKLAREGVK